VFLHTQIAAFIVSSHFGRLHPLQCSTVQRYFGVDTLKDVFENVASRNIIAYVKDINFYNRI